MPIQMQTVSARVPSDDLEWLSGLDLAGAVTPSDKLRALIAQMRRQYEGTLDHAACLAWLREMLAPTVAGLHRIEHGQQIHSEAVAAIVEWAPQIFATLLSERNLGADGVARAQAVEESLLQGCFRLLMALLRLGVTPGAEYYSNDAIDRHLPRIIELVQLIAANRSNVVPEKQP